jgi:hypothetical protein
VKSVLIKVLGNQFGICAKAKVIKYTEIKTNIKMEANNVRAVSSEADSGVGELQHNSQ